MEYGLRVKQERERERELKCLFSWLFRWNELKPNMLCWVINLCVIFPEIQMKTNHQPEGNYWAVEIGETSPRYLVPAETRCNPYRQQIVTKRFHNVLPVGRKTRRMPNKAVGRRQYIRERREYKWVKGRRGWGKDNFQEFEKRTMMGERTLVRRKKRLDRCVRCIAFPCGLPTMCDCVNHLCVCMYI